MQGVKRDMVAYPGCRSLRSLALGWLQTLLCRVWLGFQPVIINMNCAFGAAGAALLSARRIHAECAFGAAGAHVLIL